MIEAVQDAVASVILLLVLRGITFTFDSPWNTGPAHTSTSLICSPAESKRATSTRGARRSSDDRVSLTNCVGLVCRRSCPCLDSTEPRQRWRTVETNTQRAI